MTGKFKVGDSVRVKDVTWSSLRGPSTPRKIVEVYGGLYTGGYKLDRPVPEDSVHVSFHENELELA